MSISFHEMRQKSRKKQKWLLIDVSYLAWRAFYTTGQLSHDDMGTGVIFGILREVLYLQELFDTNYIAFCFDHGANLRRAQCATYKANRVIQEGFDEVKRQLKLLRTKILKEAGFHNICYDKGYEADDIIASICRDLQKNQSAIVVSADHDLYQLLGSQVKIWNPQKKEMLTIEKFTEEWGMEPTAWVDVKCIAGCSSDNIAGIHGVGEKTAAKFLNGKLNANSKGFKSIVSGNSVWKKNRSLIQLPYPGVKKFVLRVNEVTPEKWNAVAKQLGMKTLEQLK